MQKSKKGKNRLCRRLMRDLVVVCLALCLVGIIKGCVVACRYIVSRVSNSENEERIAAQPLVEKTEQVKTEATTESISELKTRLREEHYPDSLIKLLSKNPETRTFVEGYAEHKGKKAEEIDLTEEVEDGEIPLFLQWDTRWGYQVYGNDFMAVNGCGPTCLSMVYCGLTGKVDYSPIEVARMAEENGYYVEGQGSAWALMLEGAGKLGLHSSEVPYSKDAIREKLSADIPVICVVGAGDFTDKGHFIVLCDIDEEENVTVHDPNSRKNSYRTWTLDELMPQICNLWAITAGN